MILTGYSVIVFYVCMGHIVDVCMPFLPGMCTVSTRYIMYFCFYFLLFFYILFFNNKYLTLSSNSCWSSRDLLSLLPVFLLSVGGSPPAVSNTEGGAPPESRRAKLGQRDLVSDLPQPVDRRICSSTLWKPLSVTFAVQSLLLTQQPVRGTTGEFFTSHKFFNWPEILYVFYITSSYLYVRDFLQRHD